MSIYTPPAHSLEIWHGKYNLSLKKLTHSSQSLPVQRSPCIKAAHRHTSLPYNPQQSDEARTRRPASLKGNQTPTAPLVHHRSQGESKGEMEPHMHHKGPGATNHSTTANGHEASQKTSLTSPHLTPHPHRPTHQTIQQKSKGKQQSEQKTPLVCSNIFHSSYHSIIPLTHSLPLLIPLSPRSFCLPFISLYCLNRFPRQPFIAIVKKKSHSLIVTPSKQNKTKTKDAISHTGTQEEEEE